MSIGNQIYLILSFGSFAIFGMLLAIVSWWESRGQH